MTISYHFRDCKAFLVTSLDSAIASNSTFSFYHGKGQTKTSIPGVISTVIFFRLLMVSVTAEVERLVGLQEK